MVNQDNDTTLATKLVSYISNNDLFNEKDTLYLAVSGGIDSTVLCHLLFSAGYKFSILHCNFRLRGEESNRDEEFVRQLAAHFELPFFSASFDTAAYAGSKKLSIQEAARELRYAWFQSVVGKKSLELDTIRQQKKGSPKTKAVLMTAHHQEDNTETMVYHFFKGTGIHGLTGIPPKRDYIVRPMLNISRDEIHAYAGSKGIKWVEDSSNQESGYTRNFIRHELLTRIEKIIPQVRKNLAANLVRFNDADDLYEQAVDHHRKKLLIKSDTEWMIPVEKLRLSHPVSTILYELLLPFGFEAPQLPDAIQLLESQTGKWIRSDKYRLLRNRNWLVISVLADTEFHDCIISADDSMLSFKGGSIQIKRAGIVKNPGNNPLTADLNASDIRFPLVLRKWKTGDYFYPLGMKKKKKLSRFFIDLKLSKNEKEKILVLESDKRIIWIPGYRIDDRFKITDSTRDFISFEFSRE